MAKPPVKEAAKVTKTGPLCPKCGETNEWLGPHYVAARKEIVADRSEPGLVNYNEVIVKDGLSYVCSHCGYTRVEPCKDSSS